MEVWIWILIAAVLFVLFLLILGGARSEPRPRRERREQEQGDLGESMVADLLARCAQEGDKIIHKIILLNPDNGMTSEIDHILISTRGFFVIETKNLSGKIYGNDSMNRWQQYLDNGEYHDFRSPVKQNLTHIYTIKKILNIHERLENVVIFVQGNTQNITSESVYTLREFETYLNRLTVMTCLSEEERDSYYEQLMKNKQEISIGEHIANIHTQQVDLQNNICPRCKAPLVLRKGKYGEFCGCSNYPKCKFTKEID